MNFMGDIEKIHTTELGLERIRRNTGINDPINVLKKAIINQNKMTENGKNYYIWVNDIIFTLNKSALTIITAHKEKK